MTWTVSSSGTQTATINTEHNLVAADTNNASFVLKVDCTNLVNGDVLELRLYTMVLSTGALNLAWKGSYSNAQAIIVKQSPFVPSDQSIKATLKQIAGTGRSFDWSLLRQ
jgi:hypothetical protein